MSKCIGELFQGHEYRKKYDNDLCSELGAEGPIKPQGGVEVEETQEVKLNTIAKSSVITNLQCESVYSKTSANT